MDRYARWNALLELVTKQGRVGVEEAAAALAVSPATIRRDFDQLARQRLITRVRGGATAGEVSHDLPLRYKTVRHAAEKRWIGVAAAARVKLDTVVGIGGGTTTTEMARALAARPEFTTGDGDPRLTVVTNALNIANELLLRTYVKLVVTGGVVRPRSYELVGPLGDAVLRQVNLDLAVVGADAVDPVSGAAVHHEGEAAVSRLMIERARRVMVVADASKVGARAFARICPVERIDTLVTDDRIDGAALRAFREAGVDVVVAGEPVPGRRSEPVATGERR